VQHQGHEQQMVTIRNCRFIRNRAQVTGSAVDLLEGSAARIINCLFVANASNLGIDTVAKHSGEPAFTNSGVLTIFQNSRALVQGCTFTGNRNAVDDMGGASAYIDCIFADNNLAGGMAGERYELDLPAGAVVRNCRIRGKVLDPRHSISDQENEVNGSPPLFNQEYLPSAAGYAGVGFAPKKSQ